MASDGLSVLHANAWVHSIGLRPEVAVQSRLPVVMGIYVTLVEQLVKLQSEKARLCRNCEESNAALAECQNKVKLLHSEVSSDARVRDDRDFCSLEDEEQLELTKNLADVRVELETTKLELTVARKALTQQCKVKSSYNLRSSVSEAMLDIIETSKTRVYRNAVECLMELVDNQLGTKEAMSDDSHLPDFKAGLLGKEKDRLKMKGKRLKDDADSTDDIPDADNLLQKFKADVCVLVEKANNDFYTSLNKRA